MKMEGTVVKSNRSRTSWLNRRSESHTYWTSRSCMH